MAHYAALNTLFPSTDEQFENGRLVSARVNASVLGTSRGSETPHHTTGTGVVAQLLLWHDCGP